MILDHNKLVEAMGETQDLGFVKISPTPAG